MKTQPRTPAPFYANVWAPDRYLRTVTQPEYRSAKHLFRHTAWRAKSYAKAGVGEVVSTRRFDELPRPAQCAWIKLALVLEAWGGLPQ